MEPVSVRVRDCECPGTPHGEEGDLVFLAAVPSFELGLAANADIVAAMAEQPGAGTLLHQKWMLTYVRLGVTGWNLVNETGPRPLDVSELLANYALAMPVAEKADELYGDIILRPLLRRLNRISQTGPTNGSMSVPVQSIPSPRRRSSPATSVVTKPSTA